MELTKLENCLSPSCALFPSVCYQFSTVELIARSSRFSWGQNAPPRVLTRPHFNLFRNKTRTHFIRDGSLGRRQLLLVLWVGVRERSLEFIGGGGYECER